MVKEEIRLIDLKAGLPTETLAQSNDFCLMNACPSPPLRGFPPISSTGQAGRGPSGIAQGGCWIFQLVDKGKESPARTGPSPGAGLGTHVGAWQEPEEGNHQRMLSCVPSLGPAIPFLPLQLRQSSQRRKAANTDCHHFISKCLEIIHT